MSAQEMIGWLILLRDKVDLEITKVSINAPLLEISGMITSKIEELEGGDQSSNAS